MAKVKNDWKINIKKAFIGFCAYALPAIIGYIVNLNPAWMSITIGSLLLGLKDYLKHTYENEYLNML